MNADLSYTMALISRLLGYFSGHATTLKGPFALPTPISIALNILGLLFLLFTSITFNFPTSSPVTDDSMNYTCAAIGIICLVSLVTWVTTGRKSFTGPRGMYMVDGHTRDTRETGAEEPKKT